MTWLLWRQHRAQALVIGVTLVLLTVVVLITGVHMAHVYEDAVRNSKSGAPDLLGGLFRGDGAIIDTVHLTVVVPVLLGILGATLIARETEHSTNVLVWTQTVTRRRWLYSKVATALGATILISVAVTALVTWWSGTFNALNGNRFEGVQFDTQNVVPIAYALFAVALGIAAGCLLRRTLPALAATVGVFIVVRIAIANYVRPHILGTVTRTFAFGGNAAVPSGSWTVSQDLLDPSGHVLSDPKLSLPPSCLATTSRTASDSCLTRLGYRQVVRYHPASQYWHFQWTEAGIFVALAVVLVSVAIWYTLRRDA